MIDEVHSFKLTSGEEIVARIDETKTDANNTVIAYGLNKPLSIGITQQGMQLMPTMFSADPEKLMWLNVSSISIHAPSRDDIVMTYVEGTTGIRPVSKKIVMG